MQTLTELLSRPGGDLESISAKHPEQSTFVRPADNAAAVTERLCVDCIHSIKHRGQVRAAALCTRANGSSEWSEAVLSVGTVLYGQRKRCVDLTGPLYISHALAAPL